MDSVLIRSFLAIAQCGSITRAADVIGIAQPSLSQHLLRLEDELGVKLFKRSARGVALTEGGRVFEEHGLRILREIERAKEDVRGIDGEISGSVAVGLPLSISLGFAVPLVLAVKRELPQVSLIVEEAMSGHVRSWLEEGAVDFAVLYGANRYRQLSVKRIATETLCIVGRRDEFEPRDKNGLATTPRRLDEVKDLNLILPTKRHALRQFVDAALGKVRNGIDVNIEIDSLLHIKTLVAAGHGHTLLPHTAIANELRNGSLSAAVIEAPVLQRDIDIARNPARMVSRASISVEDTLTRIMRTAMETGEWVALPPSDEPDAVPMGAS